MTTPISPAALGCMTTRRGRRPLKTSSICCLLHSLNGCIQALKQALLQRFEHVFRRQAADILLKRMGSKACTSALSCLPGKPATGATQRQYEYKPCCGATRRSTKAARGDGLRHDVAWHLPGSATKQRLLQTKTLIDYLPRQCSAACRHSHVAETCPMCLDKENRDATSLIQT